MILEQDEVESSDNNNFEVEAVYTMRLPTHDQDENRYA